MPGLAFDAAPAESGAFTPGLFFDAAPAVSGGTYYSTGFGEAAQQCGSPTRLRRERRKRLRMVRSRFPAWLPPWTWYGFPCLPPGQHGDLYASASEEQFKKTVEEQFKTTEDEQFKTTEEVWQRIGDLEKQFKTTMEEFGDLAEKSGRLDGTVSVVMEEVPMMMAHLGGVSAEIEKISYLKKSVDDLHIKYKELQAYKDDQEARLSGEVEKTSNLQQSLDDLHTKCNELQAAKDALKKDAELERQSIELNFKESFDQMKRDFHTITLQTTEVILSGVDKQITPLEVALSQFST